MTTAEVESICQAIVLDYLQKSDKGLTFFKRTEGFLNHFGMGSRRNAARIQQIEDFFKQHEIVLAHKQEARASLWDFTKDESITFRLMSGASYQKTGQTQVAYDHAGTIQVVQEDSGLRLYSHQEDAVEQLNLQIGKASKGAFAGLLVLPTGGGKTLTAAYWLAKNLLDKNKKILWIAHRHELLNQAKDTFHKRLAFQDILPKRPSFNYRLISGVHDKPINIRPTDALSLPVKTASMLVSITCKSSG